MKKIIIIVSCIFLFIVGFILGIYTLNNENQRLIEERDSVVSVNENLTLKNDILVKNISSQDRFLKENCVDLDKLKEIADAGEVRSLASNYLISVDKNAYNLEFEEIYSHGNLCSFTWNIFIKFDSKDTNDLLRKGVAFLIIDPDTRELQHINVMYCFYESDYNGRSPYSCDYSYYSNYIWGETKQELINNIGLN